MLFTLISRSSDGFPLVASDDPSSASLCPNLDRYRVQAKKILGKVSGQQAPGQLSIESGAFTFHCLTAEGVTYMTLTEKGGSRKLAFAFLEELRREFSTLFGDKV